MASTSARAWSRRRAAGIRACASKWATWKASARARLRNEIGNIEAAVERTPAMGTHTEIPFVDGASTDGTKQKIEEVIARHRGERDIKLLLQVPEAESYRRPVRDADAPTVMLPLGKGDAVRKGFEAATDDVLMILDADLTVPPEDLPRFFNAIATGKGDFINGTRLVNPVEERAMKFATTSATSSSASSSPG